METFKEKVKELRRKMGWAQEDLAREIDVSLSTVQRWGGRGAKPTRLARRELARLFQEAGISNEEEVAIRTDVGNPRIGTQGECSLQGLNEFEGFVRRELR